MSSSQVLLINQLFV